MSDNDIQQIVAYQGELMLLGWSESHNGGRKVTFLVPDDCDEHPFKQFTVKNGKIAGQRFMAALVQVDDNEQPVEQRPTAEQKTDEPTKPYGHYAQALYKGGFFLAPKVLQAIGSDEEFLSWLETRQCCMRKLGGCHGDIVAAHVRRVSEGAGTGVKPKYSAVPMCDAHHRLQHQKGESALGGKEVFDRKRAYYLQEWASHALADGWFGMESMGFVEPAILRDWCMENELMMYLPGVYKA